MSRKGKYIGLNQRVPFEVLDASIQYYFQKNEIDKAYIQHLMREYTSGSNRAEKATSYVAQILSRQQYILHNLSKALDGHAYIELGIDDRKSICLCLISLTYPITYDLLFALAQGFKVQQHINKKFINEKIMALYGSNRTVDIAIDALLPIVIELKAIKRLKVGMYALPNRLKIAHKFIAELIIYTDIKLSGSKTLLVSDLSFRPWFSYFDLTNFVALDFSMLITKKESSIGKGYLCVRSLGNT